MLTHFHIIIVVVIAVMNLVLLRRQGTFLGILKDVISQPTKHTHTHTYTYIVFIFQSFFVRPAVEEGTQAIEGSPLPHHSDSVGVSEFLRSHL